eukprot:m.70829 g.70829  ORF g.70829 m.70829 type:complete len:511 (-) comp7608_c0_seq3:170-1702(-)
MTSLRRAILAAAPGSRRWLASTSAGKWEAVVGLEIHAQIAAESKMFSTAPLVFAAAPNSQVSFWDAALPGTLPAINARCVEAGVKTALALNTTINRVSEFDRKHYFYCDLPSGYQITQQRLPLAEHGFLEYGFGQKSGRVTIARLHLEHDSGKSLHTAPSVTLVDLNRAGAGLMEIVTEPDLHSGEQAASFVHTLIEILKTLGTCDGRLEEGSLRVDANISVRPTGSVAFGARCEVKNINGLRFLSKAIDYEIGRQIALIESGQAVAVETRTFDAGANKTLAMRAKGGAADYRYMPEPDLPPLRISAEQIAAIRATQPELPRAQVSRLAASGVALKDSITLVEEPGAVAYFDECQRIAPRPAQAVASWIVSELFGHLKVSNTPVAASPVQPARLCGLLDLVDRGEVSGRAAKEILESMCGDDAREPAAIADAKGLRQLSDEQALAAVCDAILQANADKVAAYRKGKSTIYPLTLGKTGLLGFFVAQVMAKTGGRANPQTTSRLLGERLGK